ncbi:MAG TPA: Asp-tRNA(Asn)/Glu-tRNA(Gln) amidotransferase subunit GatA [Bacteroidia bacterium]|nr:Asp-tRNA(Asn)/Glu-tRNA(Gln) amidotransferase subunit GatA [Bacteroidia bacterium]
MNYSSLQAIKKDMADGKLTCHALVSDYVSRIKKEKNLNAFLEVWADEALVCAKAIDEKIKLGKAGKLAGMVIGIKDNICYKGHKVSGASKILEGFESLYSATVLERLLAEDAIIIGRCNCDEFAMGSSNEKSAYGKVLNPHDNKRVPGGSSGGSTVAVAAGLCLAALGSDTGGSIRQPASFCGVVGMKPTYGKVSRYGLLAYASSFDQIGPLTNNIEDAALILEVMAGKDEFDSTMSDKSVPTYSKEYKNIDTKKLRIAYLKDCVEHTGLDPEIRAQLEKTISNLKKQGHVVEPASFPLTDYAVPSYYVLTTAEASSNLSRYSGINYGYRSPNATDLESTYKRSRTEGFGKEVKRRIMLGTFVLSAGYFDAYYAKGQKVRRLFSEQTEAILKDYDLILLPTTPGTAFEFGQNDQDPVKMYLEDIFTVQANITGLPAISLPLGKHSNGLPFGVQLMGKRHDELTLLAFSEYLMNSAS